MNKYIIIALLICFSQSQKTLPENLVIGYADWAKCD